MDITDSIIHSGGSGSSKEEYKEAISYGVVKVNMDTDMQYAYLSGVRDYVLNKKDYLMTAVGNPGQYFQAFNFPNSNADSECERRRR